MRGNATLATTRKHTTSPQEFLFASKAPRSISAMSFRSSATARNAEGSGSSGLCAEKTKLYYSAFPRKQPKKHTVL